jgi:2-polyprenyl-3-methyl-5-hydroxy-6-metoxy-1,4-benzoquinol methylase
MFVMPEPHYPARYGKPLDSSRLKRGLDKGASIADARTFSMAIKPGKMLTCCGACGSQAFSDLAQVYGFNYAECSGCGSAFVINPPSKDDIAEAYRSEYYTRANRILLANENIIDYRLEVVAKPKVGFVAEHLTTKRRTWLDVGCGVGEVLGAAVQSGFEGIGLETNQMEAEFARRKFGVEVREEYVTPETVTNYAGRYGIVSLFSVLEHVPDPRSILSVIAQIQEPGDNLVIETPHFPSLSAYSQMAFPDHVNRMLHPPLHLFLFSTKALESMLADAGYRITAAWFFGQDFYEFETTMTLLQPSIAGSRLQGAFASLRNEFQFAIDRAKLSDEMLIVAARL